MSNRIDLTQFEGIEEWGVEKRPDGGYAIKTGRDNFSLEEAETIAKLPSLIAELKRCYEEIDKLRNRPVSISCEHCSHVYEEEYLHEMLEMGPNGECVMCLEEASE